MGGEAVVAGSKAVGGVAVPFKRTVLYVTAFFFAILIIAGLVQSVQQHSIYPLLQNTLLKIISSDHQLGRAVETLSLQQTPHFTSILSKEFPVWFLWWVMFLWTIVSNLYFVFFAGWIAFIFFNSLSNDSVAKNLLLTVLAYALVSMIAGALLFVINMGGRTIPEDHTKAVNMFFSQIYPFEGTVTLVEYFVQPGRVVAAAQWINENKFAPLVTNIPQVNAT